MSIIINNIKVHTEKKLNETDLDLIYSIGTMSHLKNIFSHLYSTVKSPTGPIEAIKLEFIANFIRGETFGNFVDQEFLENLLERIRFLSRTTIELNINHSSSLESIVSRANILPISILENTCDDGTTEIYVHIFKTPTLFDYGISQEGYTFLVERILREQGVLK